MRTLERKIGAMCRAVAVQVAEALSAQGQYDGKGEENSLSSGLKNCYDCLPLLLLLLSYFTDEEKTVPEMEGATGVSGKEEDGIETASRKQVTAAEQKQEGSTRQERVPYESDDDDDEEEEEEEAEHNSAAAAAAAADLSYLSLSSLRQHLDLPIVVERKMIHDVLGVRMD